MTDSEIKAYNLAVEEAARSARRSARMDGCYGMRTTAGTGWVTAFNASNLIRSLKKGKSDAPS